MNIAMPRSGSDQKTVLIVDDTPANLGVLVDQLDEKRFQVVVAQDGEEGLQRARYVMPDIILLDVMMPGIDGFEVCRRLKADEQTFEIPIIFMTALSDTHDKLNGFEVGGVDYITKPFQIDEVVARLNTHLALREAQLRLAEQNRQLQRALEERRRDEALRIGQGQLFEMMATGVPLDEVLTGLMRLVESQLEVAAALFLRDEHDSLQIGAAPSLPGEFHRRYRTHFPKGERLADYAGPDRAAVCYGEAVWISDIETASDGIDHCSLALSHGVRAGWSVPVIGRDDRMLGILVLYFRDPRQHTQLDDQILEIAIRVAAIAIERQRTQEQIVYMAHHDALTGLPNRVLLEDRLNQALLLAQRYTRQVTVAFIDLDHFKLINDSLGHKCGDELLQTIAQRLADCARRTDTVVRLGGDEFVIVLYDQPSPTQEIAPVIKRIQDALMRPIALSGHEIRVTSSIGLSSYPQDGVDADRLLSNADAAMYHAKESGRNTYQLYQVGLESEAKTRLVLEEGLHQALARDELQLHYQAQFDLHSRQIIGMEALLRWYHPELGMIPPGRFIQLAETSGAIVPIGNWVLQTACRQNKAWQEAGLPKVAVAVNVSARQFRDKGLLDQVEQALEHSGLEPRYLELELTESMVMQEPEQAVEIMRHLNEMGVMLSIDDFGTGYSSLSSLKKFPVARLKIDKSFVTELPNSMEDRSIAQAVIALGHSLNLKVIAEGVENQDQLSFLHEQSCDEIQGFLFSRPTPAEEFENLLRTGVRQVE